MRWLAGLLAGFLVAVGGVAEGGHGAVTGHAAAGRDPAALASSNPGPPPAVGDLTGVACVSSARCMAVGGSSGPGDGHALAELWDGSRWTQLVTPSPANEDLADVACPRASLCQAVGTVGAEKWNGTAWTVEKLPASVRAPSLGSVSCPTVSDCVAVGARSNGTMAVTLAEIWNGSTWTVHNPVNPPGALEVKLSSVSCSSTTDCIAVGDYEVSNNFFAALAEKWNGSAWKPLALPTLAASSTSLSGISCASATSCVAVGGADQASLAEFWNGTTWAVLPTPPGGPTAISCATATSCMATGGTHAESWNGRSWTSLGTPPLTLFVKGVSCISAATCMAVGHLGGVGSFAMSWNGSTWHASRVDKLGMLPGVSCTLAIHCMAIGSYLTTSDLRAGLAEFWNGSAWTRRTTPAFPHGGRLADVSCRSVTDCVAVGGSEEAATLAEVWNGISWRITPTPSRPAGSQEDAVSCAGRYCLAVGRSMLSELWNGSIWRVVAVPLPSPNVGGGLTDVSCSSSAHCMATGSYFTSKQSNPVSLAELWNGTTWRALRPPGGGLSTVSCTSRVFCMAMGQGTAVIWNGKKWRTQELPGLFGFGPGITAVSCVRASACMAVGNYLASTPKGIVGFNVAASWNGSRWRRLPTPGPGGGLANVSCTSPTRCMATGQAPAGQVATRTLAMRWNGTRWLLLATPNP